MARPILLSNGQLHVGLNIYGLVHDFYYPYVGLENHAAAKQLRHRIGVYVGGYFSWLDDGSWEVRPDYYGDVLVSHTVAIHEGLQVRLEFDDCVDSELNAFLRNIHVINMADTEREIKLFMHQVFVISDSNASDTAQYVPDDHAIIHYKGHRTFVIGATYDDGQPFDEYSVGLFRSEGHDGTYRDAEDGVLEKNKVEHGMVDSVIGLYITIPAHSSKRAHYWVAAGRSAREAKKVSAHIMNDGLLHHLLKTARHWAEWIKPTKDIAKKLPEAYRSGFIRSALLVKAQTDKHGAVIASTDTTMLNYSRDSYAYCWPRDGAYCLWPLMRIGYTDELLHFFAFCRRTLHDDGYLAHKYQADGAVGSSWHPYGDTPPIQTDETALVLFLFGQYYRMHPEPELLENFYRSLVTPMAGFLSSYVDESGLPLPSYDLWEEKHLTSTYTTALTYAALIEATYLADTMKDQENAVRWRTAAETMHAERNSFYNPTKQYFYKGFTLQDGERVFDDTIDSSSLFGAFMYGFIPVDDPTISNSFETLKLTLMSDGAKVIRYENDVYRRVGDEPSNPWPITSLWYAQYALEQNDHEQARAILDWVTAQMLPSGVLAEQYTSGDKPLSVAPLTWSQAEYMSALLDMITAPQESASS